LTNGHFTKNILNGKGVKDRIKKKTNFNKEKEKKFWVENEAFLRLPYDK